MISRNALPSLYGPTTRTSAPSCSVAVIGACETQEQGEEERSEGVERTEEGKEGFEDGEEGDLGGV